MVHERGRPWAEGHVLEGSQALLLAPDPVFHLSQLGGQGLHSAREM